MRVFWDTSAAINALVSPQVWDRLSTDQHFARLHLFAEFFATMTGRGIPVKDRAGNLARMVLTPSDAARWLREFAAKVDLVELTPQETLDALDGAARHGVQGGRVYDYGHSLAADKVGAEVLLTRNIADFTGLPSQARLEWP
jgi:hypothetical protein